MTRRELLILAAAAPRAGAQFTSGVSIVNAQVTVRDKQGDLVRDLTKDAFELTDEGRKQELQYFSFDSDLPLTIGMLFDVSGSQRKLLGQQLGAARTFLEQVLRPGDQAFVAGFDQRYLTAARPTDSPEELFANLSRLAEDDAKQTGTALFDAITRAAETMSGLSGRKVLIVLSDGQDTASTTPLKEAIEAVQRANTTIFAVRIFDREVFAFQVQSAASRNLEDGRVALEKMSKETGGSLLEGTGKTPLEVTFEQLGEELRSQYSLGFSPQEGRPGYHRLRVKVQGKGLKVQARDGYFAPQ